MAKSKTPPLSSGLATILAAKTPQRLSIAEIHWRWNAELRRQKGHTPYDAKRSARALMQEHPAYKTLSDVETWEELSTTALAMLNAGKWQDNSGKIVADEPIAEQLITLINRGDLPAYTSADPADPPCKLAELQPLDLRTKQENYLIDRDELGGLLFTNRQPLPAFWYRDADYAAFKHRLTQGDSVRNLQDQLKAAMAENKTLKQQLKDRWPVMNPEHPYFTPELEAANSAWMALFAELPKDAKHIPQKPKIQRWLLDNRPEAVNYKDGKFSQRALDRIAMILNPIRIGGRPKK